MSSLIQSWRSFWLCRRLHRAIKTHAERLFSPVESKTALEALAGSSFPNLENRTSETLRVKLAILILSEGKWDRFQDNLKAANGDWRDVLIAAGMAVANWREVLGRKGVSI